MKQRVLVSCLLGTSFGLLALLCCRLTHLDGGDFGLAWYQARELLAGRSPYPPAAPAQILYPMTAALFAIPFTPLSANVAGALFFGLSCTLLSFFIAREGWHRLLIFAALPFFSSLLVIQWQPLLMASVFVPWLGAAVLKPQIGIVCAIASRKWSALWSAILIGLASLAVRPQWPIEFWKQAQTFPHFSPILFSFGPVMLLVAYWWKDRDVQLLLLMAIAPQRFFYDAFVLWLIPKSTKEILFVSTCSWFGFAIWYDSLPLANYHQVWMWSYCLITFQCAC